MRKVFVVFLFFFCGLLFADEDYKWDLINALIRSDFTTVETIVNSNIDTIPAIERRLILNFTVTYSHGDTTLMTLDLLRRHGILPGSYELYTVINRNQPDNVIQFVVNAGAEANGEILLLAMEKQRYEFARQFILAGVDVNYQYPLSRNYADGMTPLLYAVRYNNFDLVRLLTENDANVNAVDINGSSPLSIARLNENTQISDYLIEQGADQMQEISVVPQVSSGIAEVLGNQSVDFQPGTYMLSGGTTTIRFLGTANTGSISYITSGWPSTGIYLVQNGILTIMIEGSVYTYSVNSNLSFSGNGEVWVRSGS